MLENTPYPRGGISVDVIGGGGDMDRGREKGANVKEK